MKAENISATLVTHSGAVKIQREDLWSLATPARTHSHTPVAHHHLVDLIEARLWSHRMQINKLNLAVQNNGMKMFGTMVLKHERDDFAFALGFRAANDKTIPITVVAGGSVFCCDNMVLSGQEDVMCRKHTARLDVREEVFAGMDRAIAKFTDFEAGVVRLKLSEITDTEAKALIYDAVADGVMIPKFAASVGREYFEPRHKEFEPRTRWSLHNAFTETFKQIERPNIALECTTALGKLFSI